MSEKPAAARRAPTVRKPAVAAARTARSGRSSSTRAFSLTRALLNIAGVLAVYTDFSSDEDFRLDCQILADRRLAPRKADLTAQVEELFGQKFPERHWSVRVEIVEVSGAVSESEIAKFASNGIIRPEMPDDSRRGPGLNFELPPTPESPSKAAELIRVLSEALPVDSAAHEELRTIITNDFIETHGRADGEVMETLGLLAVRSGQAARIRRDIDALVAEARRNDIGWTALGRAAGITSQAARRRWDADARKQHSEYARAPKPESKK